MGPYSVRMKRTGSRKLSKCLPDPWDPIKIQKIRKIRKIPEIPEIPEIRIYRNSRYTALRRLICYQEVVVNQGD